MPFVAQKELVMKNILVTGAAGFMGKNLVTALQRLDDISLTTITSDDDRSALFNQDDLAALRHGQEKRTDRRRVADDHPLLARGSKKV